jgi:hypothetical protein
MQLMPQVQHQALPLPLECFNKQELVAMLKTLLEFK